MKATIGFVLILAVLTVAGGVSGQNLTLFNAEVYETANHQAAFGYGLFKKGCAVYTSNDGCGATAHNHVLYVPETGTDAVVQDVGQFTTTACQQQLYVQDFYSPYETYLFLGHSFGFDTDPGLYIFQVKDSGDCTNYIQTDNLTWPSPLQCEISMYDTVLYVSNYDGIYEVAFDQATGTAQIEDLISGCMGHGAYRVGDTLYELHTPGSGDAGNTFVVAIRSALDMQVTYDSLVISNTQHSITEPKSTFKIARDTFVVDGVAEIRTVGVFATTSDYDYLYVFDLSGGSVNQVYSQWYTGDVDQFHDLHVLDRQIFLVGTKTPDAEGDLSGFVWVIDISDLSNIGSPVAELEVQPDLQSPNPIEAAIAQETGLEGVCKLPTLIRMSRTVTEGAGGAWYTQSSPAYSLFSHWSQSDAGSGPEDDRTELILWHMQYTPGSVETFAVGDVNNDGNVNIGDVLAIRNYILGQSTVVYRPVSRYDVNNDGYITLADARRLIWWIFSAGDNPGYTCNTCP